MLKIEFDANNKPLAAAIGRALTEYAADKQSSAVSMSVVKNEEGDIAMHRDVADPSWAPSNDDPKLSSALSADGHKEPATSEQSSETSSETPSTTQTTESASPADTAAVECKFEQYWQNAAGDQYAGHPIDPELGVPVDAKGFPLIDTYGVPFNADWCQKAKDPFYASGKNEKGKWKARVGTGKQTFLDWHRMQLEESTETQEPAPTADPAAAFGGQTETTPAASDKPTGNIGELMTWISEHQTAGHFTSDQITMVYEQCGTSVAALAQPDNQGARDTVYSVLSGMIGA